MYTSYMATLYDATKGAGHPQCFKESSPRSHYEEVPCAPSFLSLGIVTLKLRWVFAGHGEVGDELPGRGHRESCITYGFSTVSLGG